METLDKKGRDLLKKKEARLAKIEDRLRKEAKEQRRMAYEKDVSRSMKRKMVEDSRIERVRHSEQLYREHLEEVSNNQAEKAKR